jgi:hypothetical protein
MPSCREACSLLGLTYVIALKLVPVSAPTVTVPWESAFYLDGSLPSQWDNKKVQGWYQQGPNTSGQTFKLIPRLISPKPGDLPDVNVVAQGEPFVFTTCDFIPPGGDCL